MWGSSTCTRGTLVERGRMNGKGSDGACTGSGVRRRVRSCPAAPGAAVDVATQRNRPVRPTTRCDKGGKGWAQRRLDFDFNMGHARSAYSSKCIVLEYRRGLAAYGPRNPIPPSSLLLPLLRGATRVRGLHTAPQVPKCHRTGQGHAESTHFTHCRVHWRRTLPPAAVSGCGLNR